MGSVGLSFGHAHRQYEGRNETSGLDTVHHMCLCVCFKRCSEGVVCVLMCVFVCVCVCVVVCAGMCLSRAVEGGLSVYVCLYVHMCVCVGVCEEEGGRE